MLHISSFILKIIKLYFFILQKKVKGPGTWWDVLCCINGQVRLLNEFAKFSCTNCNLQYWALYMLCSGVVVSAGIIRILGQELAELPLVATRSNKQGQVIIICHYLC